MLPLEGITVVDLSRALAGPYCTTMLADFGANVIKVESQTGGDPSRSWPPFDADGRSLYFESVNRNKRSLSLNFYSDEGHDILERLITQADVLVENFKFGTLMAMGFDEEKLSELNPELLHVSINAYGDSGPLRDLPGLDQVIQAASGITSVTGPVGGTGYRVGLPIIDITSGMNAAFGIVTALLGRERGVSTSTISTSLFETAMGMSVFQGQQAISLGRTPQAQGNSHPSIAPYGVFPTSSDPLVVAVSTDKHWHSFTRILGAEHWLDDARFASAATRAEHREVLDELITDLLAKAPAEEWITRFRSSGIPSGPVNDYAQAFDSAQAKALELVQTVSRADGSVAQLVRSPLSRDGHAAAVRTVPPQLGEHTEAILGELGLSDEILVATAVSTDGARP